MSTTAFVPGSLVRARGREWVVLPGSDGDLVRVRPLGGTDDEETAIWRPIEPVEPAAFAPPDWQRPGDHRSTRLLRDAVRLGIRAGTGPFRSFAHLGVDPRPYQLVPLMMALRLDPVRLLIADDVGIGKTVEACLIARELLDRGEARRLAVLCPPHLAEQWQGELSSKFHIDAELVLAGTAARLERTCRVGESLFERYPYTVVSLDFVRGQRHREQFLVGCPELVLVDEAHSCADAGEGRGNRHLRYALLTDLARDPDRHLVLVTATPHSGKEQAFRSLLTLLDPELAGLPEDLGGDGNRRHRHKLARYFVQRGRGDIRAYLDAETPFPERKEAEATYRLTPTYRALLERALDFARETTAEVEHDRRLQRVRWWSVLALLRSLSSSPAAAVATLRARSGVVDAASADDADEIGRQQVMDLLDERSGEDEDSTPGADFEEAEVPASPYRRRMLEMARQAQKLWGDDDPKLTGVVPILRDLIKDGFQPIVFCRFISTADYVGAELRERLPKGVTVEVVTGLLPPAEREARVAGLGQAPKRVLVATDCLSEGINLQDSFDAVVHYDLSWNPTRHEQREGRVDRFGQRKKQVRVVTYYGKDNPVDGLVWEVLVRKHQTIRNALGISIPVPVDSQQVVSAIMEGLVLRGRTSTGQLKLFEREVQKTREEVDLEWQNAADREKRSRRLFAQETLDPGEVARELRAAREAVGAGVEVRAFVRSALVAHGARVTDKDGALCIDLSPVSRALREAVGADEEKKLKMTARLSLPAVDDELYLTRTHPFVAGLAAHATTTALDPQLEGVARRCGAIFTRDVAKRTTLLLLRLRFHLETGRGFARRTILAEEATLLAFRGAPASPEWLPAAEAEALLGAEPSKNLGADVARERLREVVDALPRLEARIVETARERAAALAEAHARVRQSARPGGTAHRVTPHLPPDVLGVYVFLPGAA